MIINMNNFSVLWVNLFGVVLWLVVIVWEKALGWPVLTLFGLVLFAAATDQPGLKMVKVGLGCLVLVGLFNLPASAVIVWLVVATWLAGLTNRWLAGTLMAWLGVILINYGQTGTVGGVVELYLFSLSLISLWVLSQRRNWRLKKLA